MTTPGRVIARLRSELRVLRVRTHANVEVGTGVRLGPRVSVSANGGKIRLGNRVEIGGGTTLVASDGGVISIGDDVFISGACIVAARRRVEIGDGCMLAEMVCVRDHDHDPDSPPKSGAMLIGEVSIGKRVWIASKASVVRGGSVGDDSVVAAHALVNKPIPASVIAAGVPATVKRSKRSA